jgi:hypothetical protein
MNFSNLNNNNINNYNEQIYGAQEGLISGQHDRVEDINSKIYSRNSDYNHEYSPIFEPRSTPTKQSVFPILNLRNAEAPLISTFDYDKEVSTKVPVENRLHSRIFALQKGANQSIYVPSSTSDLYNVSISYAPSVQPFPMLFSESTFDNQTHPNIKPSIGNNVFGNNTRVQLRNL